MVDPNHHRLTPAIELKDVVKYFDDALILNKISFTVRRGETNIILGGSGSGKSTILKLIIGLEKPDEGEIWVDGENISRYRESELMSVRQKIGMVFQEGALFDSLSVADNVAYRLHEQGELEEEEILAIVKKTSTRCPLSCQVGCGGGQLLRGHWWGGRRSCSMMNLLLDWTR